MKGSLLASALQAASTDFINLKTTSSSSDCARALDDSLQAKARPSRHRRDAKPAQRSASQRLRNHSTGAKAKERIRAR